MTNETQTSKPVTVNIELDPVLHRALKVQAAKNGQSLKAAVIEAIGTWVEMSNGR